MSLSLLCSPTFPPPATKLRRKNMCVWRVCSQGHSWRECHAHSGNNNRSNHIGVCEPFLNISSPRANSETSGGQSHSEGHQIQMMQRGEMDTETTGRWACTQGAFPGSPEVPRRREDTGGDWLFVLHNLRGEDATDTATPGCWS